MKRSVGDIMNEYVGFPQTEQDERLSDLINYVGMMFLTVAFIPIEPLISSLTALIGSLSAIRYFSASDGNIVDNNLIIITAILLLTEIAVFGFVFNI